MGGSRNKIVITRKAFAFKSRRSAPKSLRAIGSDVRGATIIEFAVVATPLAALLLAILETSLTFFAQQTLETTTEAAARQLMTGAVQQTAGMDGPTFKTLVCSKLPIIMKCANLMVDVQQANSFSAVSTAPPTVTYDSSGQVNNTWKFTPGGADTINVVKVMYLWQEQLGPLGLNLSNTTGGKRILIATAVFKTEPYNQ